jgi:hypothetical protein
VLGSEIQLTCPVASDCGISPKTPLYEAFFRHPDLSIYAARYVFLPFLHPIVHAMQQAPEDLTVFIPASTASLRFNTYGIERFCGENSAYRDDAVCDTWKKLNEIEEAVVRNSQQLAQNGQQKVRSTQKQASTDRGRASDECWVEKLVQPLFSERLLTLFLPGAFLCSWLLAASSLNFPPLFSSNTGSGRCFASCTTSPLPPSCRSSSC